jgi:protein TonB
MSKRRNHLPLVITCLAGVSALGGGAFALIRIVKSAAPPPKQVVQEIHLIRPPPPPPDVPPPPPPPPQEKVDIPDPQQQPDPTPSNEPPPAANLGLDAEGGAGGDAFGLVGNKGGRDITAVGGSAVAWYAGLLRDQIRDVLNGDGHIRNGAYRVSLRVWVSVDGTVQRVEIVHGSGNADRDHAIEADLQQIKRMPQAPPAGMPDAISLEVRAQG